jgi:hypothetical protein
MSTAGSGRYRCPEIRINGRLYPGPTREFVRLFTYAFKIFKRVQMDQQRDTKITNVNSKRENSVSGGERKHNSPKRCAK